MAEVTLQHISRGGIHDHIGGGFSRYSVDELWMVRCAVETLNSILALRCLMLRLQSCICHGDSFSPPSLDGCAIICVLCAFFLEHKLRK